jgi:hypothetical protein
MTGLRLVALLAALGGLALLAGCSGSFAPTLPTPPAGGGNSVLVHGVGAELPGGLTASNFKVTLNGTPTTVTNAVKVGGSRPLAITFVVDTTGSMGSTIGGVKSTIAAFAESLSGHAVTWAGVEFGDEVRTSIAPTSSLTDFEAWLNTLGASGGGDGAENDLDALMAARLPASDPSGIGLGWNYPAGADRYFIVFTDIYAHQPGDGSSFAHFSGDQVRAAFNGWAVIDCDSVDLSGSSAASASLKNNDGTPASIRTAAETVGYYDVRELADGYSYGAKLNNGTGGIWIDLFGEFGNDLTKLGIKEQAESGYIVSFIVPNGMTSADVVVTGTWSGGTDTWSFPGYVF